MSNNSNARGNSQSGFTLVELSVVLVIIGILMTALIPIYQNYFKSYKVKKLEATMGTVRTALADFIIDDSMDPDDPGEVRYPCPAPLDAPIGSANYGKEQCITGGPGTCSNGVCVRAGTGGKRILVGAVPTRSLSIPGDNMVDSYGNRLTYAITADLTAPESMKQLTTAGAVTIVDEGGTVTNNAQFALVSHGIDGAGSYTGQGVLNGNPCRSTTSGDAENCNGDATFRISAGEVSADSPDFYDDEAAFTLVEDQDDQWWRQVDDSGQDIVNRNPRNVAIGFITGAPTQKLDVNGAMRARNNIMADNDITSGNTITAVANITSTTGAMQAALNVIAGQNVQAGMNVMAGQAVTAGTNVQAGQNVIAGSAVNAGSDVTAVRDMTAGNNVLAQNEVRAKNNVRAERAMYAKNFFYNDTPSSGAGGSGVLTFMCPSGQVLRGVQSGTPVCVQGAGAGSDVSCPEGEAIRAVEGGIAKCSPIFPPGQGPLIAKHTRLFKGAADINNHIRMAVENCVNESGNTREFCEGYWEACHLNTTGNDGDGITVQEYSRQTLNVACEVSLCWAWFKKYPSMTNLAGSCGPAGDWTDEMMVGRSNECDRRPATRMSCFYNEPVADPK